MGSAYSIKYVVKTAAPTATTYSNLTEHSSGDSASLEEQDGEEHTLYYCGMLTWRSSPCGEMVDETWAFWTGMLVLLLFLLISIWACQPQVQRVVPVKYSALPPSNGSAYRADPRRLAPHNYEPFPQHRTPVPRHAPMPYYPHNPYSPQNPHNPHSCAPFCGADACGCAPAVAPTQSYFAQSLDLERNQLGAGASTGASGEADGATLRCSIANLVSRP